MAGQLGSFGSDRTEEPTAHTQATNIAISDEPLSWYERGNDLFASQRYEEAFAAYE